MANNGGEATMTTIFYYTGTGNSLWIARALARELGNTQIMSMADWKSSKHVIESQMIGLVFPVHIWGVPARVLEFLEYLPAMNAEYLFAIANNAGQVSNTLVQLKKEMQNRGLTLGSGWSVVMPSNYIPWGGPGPLSKQNQRFAAASTRITQIAGEVSAKALKPVEKGPLWQRVLFTWLYNISFPRVHEMDRNFWVDERCNQCGICVKLCPSNNIVIDGNKLSWQNRCEQCLSCIQWCPQEALQYGKKTSSYERYHHPDIKLKDLLKK